MKSRFKLGVLILSTLFSCHGKAVVESEIFSWDEQGRLGVSFSVNVGEQTYALREVRTEDTSFVQGIFRNPDLMKHFGSGKLHEKEDVQTQVQFSVEECLGKGRPRGMLIGEDAGKQIYWTSAKEGYFPGTSEIAHILEVDSQKKGLEQVAVGLW